MTTIEDVNNAISSNLSPPTHFLGQPSKWKSLVTRASSAFAMIAGFVTILAAGHVPTILLIFIIQGLMVRELFALAVEVRKEKDVPWFRLQQWYFYGTAVFFTYGRFLKHKWLESSIVKAPERLGAFGLFMFAHHSFISYIGWMVGLVLFVLSLRSRGLYLYQFGQFAWTHMIIVTILMQSSCFVANVLEGMIWFVFPVSIVFFNDAAAYMCGFFFGRTPLIKISPKKTWEGFIGGLIVTLIVAPFAAAWMQKYEWLICPVDDKSPLRLFGGASGCDVDPLFVAKEVTVGSIVGGFESALGWMVPHGWVATVARALFGLETMRVSWFQVHAVVFASFASIIAPFGGFFASGFKRAFKIKDFSDTIPGHGGITDRMDCQMVMALFSHLYITNFIRQPGLMTVGQLLLKIEFLTNENLLRLYKAVGKMIVTRGLKLP